MPMILSHIDLRVRNRVKAIEFYDALLNVLGAVKSEGESFVTWEIPPHDAGSDFQGDEWFGITEDPAMTPGSSRIAFNAPSRGTIDAITVILPALGARNIEKDDGIYGNHYHAVFFEDPDGNRLEVCHIGS